MHIKISFHILEFQSFRSAKSLILNVPLKQQGIITKLNYYIANNLNCDLTFYYAKPNSNYEENINKVVSGHEFLPDVYGGWPITLSTANYEIVTIEFPSLGFYPSGELHIHGFTLLDNSGFGIDTSFTRFESSGNGVYFNINENVLDGSIISFNEQRSDISGNIRYYANVNGTEELVIYLGFSVA